jgi:hypothetical protein
VMGLTAIVLGPRRPVNCRVCRLARAWGWRGQASIAVTSNVRRWPRLMHRLTWAPNSGHGAQLHPREAMRGNPIAAVALTGADTDVSVLSPPRAFSFVLSCAMRSIMPICEPGQRAFVPGCRLRTL